MALYCRPSSQKSRWPSDRVLHLSPAWSPSWFDACFRSSSCSPPCPSPPPRARRSAWRMRRPFCTTRTPSTSRSGRAASTRSSRPRSSTASKPPRAPRTSTAPNRKTMRRRKRSRCSGPGTCARPDRSRPAHACGGAGIWSNSQGQELRTPTETVTWLDDVHAWKTLTEGNLSLHTYNASPDDGPPTPGRGGRRRFPPA